MAALTDKVRKWISKDIGLGIYKPGSRMPTRMELMRKYKLARASVDKVIGQLVEEGLLVSARGSGTYVVDKSLATTHLYVVLNTELECSEANRFHARLGEMLAGVSGGKNFSLLGSAEVEGCFSEIIGNPRSRVIWSRPSIKSYGDIASLDRAGIRQVLVNRPIREYNFVSTDTKGAMREIFETLCVRHENPRFGLLAPPIGLEESFLAERELCFQEMVHRFGASLGFLGRTESKAASELIRMARMALDRVHEIDYLFVPDFSMVPYVWALASERSIEMGKDLTLITIDWEEDPSGVVCVRQNWEAMLAEAVSWANNAESSELHSLVPAEVVYPFPQD